MEESVQDEERRVVHTAWSMIALVVALVAAALTLLVVTQSPSSAQEEREDRGYVVREEDGILRDTEGNPYVAGELLVNYEDRIPSDADDKARARGGKVKKKIREAETVVLDFPELKKGYANELKKIKDALANQPGVEAVEYNYIARPAYRPNDPYYVGNTQNNLKQVGANRVWSQGYRGQRANVAVIDSGVAAAHQDFSGQIGLKYDFVDRDTLPQDSTNHGTGVTSTISATTYNGVGMAAAAPQDAAVLAARVCDAEGFCTYDRIVEALYWARDNGAEVSNMSLGGSAPSLTLEEAVNDTAEDMINVCSAGNSGQIETAVYPAAFQGCVGVGAVDDNDNHASFSSAGPYVDVVAPGVTILVASSTGGYRYASGTSFSAPHVAAEAAILRGQGRGVDNARTVLQRDVKDLGKSGRDYYYGNGRVDFYLAAN